MERFPIELLYVLIFIGVILFNMVQAVRRRQREAQAEAQQPELSAEDEPLEDVWGRHPAPEPAFVPPPRPAPTAAPSAPLAPLAPRRRHPLQTLLKDRRNLHHAIVLMAVLGPCRAQEPPEQR